MLAYAMISWPLATISERCLTPRLCGKKQNKKPNVEAGLHHQQQDVCVLTVAPLFRYMCNQYLLP